MAEKAFRARCAYWVRKIQSFDGYLFVGNGLKGYHILTNALECIELEMAYKAADVIYLGNGQIEDAIDLFRTKLIQRRSLPLSNGFELSEVEAGVQREAFGDHFSMSHKIKVQHLFKDLEDVAFALKDHRLTDNTHFFKASRSRDGTSEKLLRLN